MVLIMLYTLTDCCYTARNFPYGRDESIYSSNQLIPLFKTIFGKHRRIMCIVVPSAEYVRLIVAHYPDADGTSILVKIKIT